MVKESAREPSATRRNRLWCGALLVTAWAVWSLIIIFSLRMIAAHAIDFDAYYAAAQALRFDHSANIYAISTLLQGAHSHGLCALSGHLLPPYLYPPLLAIALEPLTLAPCADAALIWLLVNAMLWLLTTLLLANLLAQRWPGRRQAAITTMTVASLCFLQAFYGLFLGQVHLLILFGLVLALWLVDGKHLWLAGAVLAALALIKLLPALLIVYYLARGRWRVVGGAAVASIGLVAVMLVYSSPATLLGSGATLFSLAGNVAASGANESLGIVTANVGPLLMALVGLVWLGVVLRRRGGDDLLGAGWTACTMLLLSPLVWSFYLVWLLPAFCACLAALGPLSSLGRGAWRMRAGWAALALLYLVTALPLALSLRPFATLALWALTGALYWRSGAVSRRSPEGVEPGAVEASRALSARA